MEKIFVSIENETVSIDEDVCSFYDAGLYVNDDSVKRSDGSYQIIDDPDIIIEIFSEKEPEKKCVFI